MDDGASIYDLPPAFEQAFYRFEVEENVPTGRIGKIEVDYYLILFENISVSGLVLNFRYLIFEAAGNF